MSSLNRIGSIPVIDGQSALSYILSGKARAQYDKQIQELQKQRDEAWARMQEAQAASDKAWQDLHKGYEAAWENIAKSFKDAMGRFR